MNVFFGIMTGDLFLGEEYLPEGTTIDYDASVEKYAQMCEKQIMTVFPEAEVQWVSEDYGKAVPYNLQTTVNGDFDHENVQDIDDILGKVWETWEWLAEQ